MPNPDVTLRDIYLARRRISSLVRRTPLLASPALAELTGAPVYLKAENLQPTGSFKIRGAANKTLSLTDEEKQRGVITVSSGNHGRAVAYAAKRLGVRAVVCMSERVPGNKVEAIEKLEAEVVRHGDSYDEAEKRALQLREERGLTLIEPFDDPLVIAGQGTIGLELLEELPQVETAIAPLSGGGLIAGIALALKSANPAIRVIGVSMERAPVMYHSLKAGEPIEMEEEDTLADALVGGIGSRNEYTFHMVQQLVDDVVLVSEEEIASSMVFALEEQRLVVEGGGAVGLAALLHRKVSGTGRNVVVVLSGGNVSLPLLLQVVEGRL